MKKSTIFIKTFLIISVLLSVYTCRDDDGKGALPSLVIVPEVPAVQGQITNLDQLLGVWRVVGKGVGSKSGANSLYTGDVIIVQILIDNLQELNHVWTSRDGKGQNSSFPKLIKAGLIAEVEFFVEGEVGPKLNLKLDNDGAELCIMQGEVCQRRYKKLKRDSKWEEYLAQGYLTTKIWMRGVGDGAEFLRFDELSLYEIHDVVFLSIMPEAPFILPLSRGILLTKNNYLFQRLIRKPKEGGGFELTYRAGYWYIDVREGQEYLVIVEREFDFPEPADTPHFRINPPDSKMIKTEYKIHWTENREAFTLVNGGEAIEYTGFGMI